MSRADAKRARGTDRADPVRVTSVTSTEAQNALGELIDRAGRGERVYITRYGRPQAVLLSSEAYAQLLGTEPVDLDELEQEFEARVRDMGSSEHRAAVDTLFEMTGDEVGAASVRRDGADGVRES